MTPESDPVTHALEDVLEVAGAVTSGAVASYIPELASVDPEPFGISLVGVLGRVYNAGANETMFTIQSISKAFVYALAVHELGLDAVHRHVGFEPSGQPFNAISLDASGRPDNPMINVGAIVTSALVDGSTPDRRFERIRATLSAFAGRELELDVSVYESESATGDRNRALAYLAHSSAALPRTVDDATDVYFRQCSLLVNATDLAVMGATLANGGTNPVTGVRVIDDAVARHTLSLMGSCGMYDRAGEWALRVGMPAKSGVGGGIVAVKPGQFGVGVFSPRLDEVGNSSRGVAALTLLSHDYGLHLFEHVLVPASPIEKLAKDPAGGLMVSLQGELDFVSAVRFVHELEHPAYGALDEAPITLDLSAVTRVAPAAERLLVALAARVRSSGHAFVVIDPASLAPALGAD